jgi:hypothetical protein
VQARIPSLALRGERIPPHPAGSRHHANCFQRKYRRHEPGGRAPAARRQQPGREQEQHEREGPRRNYPDPVHEPLSRPGGWQRPRCDQPVPPVPLAEETQTEQQASSEEDPTDLVAGPPGCQHEAHDRDGDERQVLEDIRKVPQPRRREAPTQIRQRQFAQQQQNRQRRHAAGHPAKSPGSHPRLQRDTLRLCACSLTGGTVCQLQCGPPGRPLARRTASPGDSCQQAD